MNASHLARTGRSILGADLPSRERGAALLVGLVFIIILTMLGITAANVAIIEERIAGNLRDRNIATQAAEAALRYAERDIIFSGRINGIEKFDQTCTAGLCYAGRNKSFTTAVWLDSTKWANAKTYGWTSSDSSVLATELKNVEALNGIYEQPTYLIEGFPKQFPGLGASEVHVYRITVRATGANQNTVVWLQETFIP